jgi:hypothetical protein
VQIGDNVHKTVFEVGNISNVSNVNIWHESVPGKNFLNGIFKIAHMNWENIFNAPEVNIWQHSAGKKIFAQNLGITWLEKKKKQLCGWHQWYSRRLTGKMGNNARMMKTKWFNWGLNDLSHLWWESMSY